MIAPPSLRPALFILLYACLMAAPGHAESTTGFLNTPGGGRLWYEVRGEGTPIVFLHDGLLSSATWDGPFDAFSKGFRAVRYDRRGFGRSEPAKGAYSDVDDLHAVFETLKIGRAALVGCSNGSRLALDYALAYPDRVEALVLVGPVVSGLPYSEHFLRRGMANYRPMFQEKSREKLIEAWVQDPYLTDARSARGRARLRELLTKNPEPLAAGFPASRPPDRPAVGRLAEIRVPTLIVAGASDIPDVHTHAGALEAGIHGARRVIFPAAGHLVQLEKPDELDREIRDFLRPADSAAAYLKTSSKGFDLAAGRRLFDDDANQPLDVREARTESRGDVRIVDLSYASPLGGRVPAYLILPPGAGKHPAVLFLHPGQGSRSTFVDEAVSLAKERGFAALTISAPFLRPENKGRRGGNPWDPAMSRKEQIQTIVDLRRGFDLLAARPEVDPRRLAYVGHSLGATVGGTLAGIEKRPIAFVLMAGYPALTRGTAQGHDQGSLAFQELLTPEQQKAYVDALAPIDAVHYVGDAAPAKLLFQFARRDEFITPVDAAIYLQAASEPKEVQWYDTDHYFNEEARRDRGAWLEGILSGR
ncbi:MAG TPA: alpha/beta fold hydrolase [Thermoanaerobaculia bacterium]|jgi:pimeloyl-ACP methyl ester carboxylesterase/dienelactone hydrolase